MGVFDIDWSHPFSSIPKNGGSKVDTSTNGQGAAGWGAPGSYTNPDGTPRATKMPDAGQPDQEHQGQVWNPGTSSWGPYTTGPGATSGQTQPQFEGLNFTKRGPAEVQWISLQPFYNTPLFGETNNEKLVTQFANKPNDNNTQNWFSQFASSMPTIASDPGLGAYYENAKNRAAESIARQTAARGSYGSSSANDATARAITDLEGERARQEADYNLRRLGEQRAWEGLGGQLAGAADQTSQGWLNLLSGLGTDASRLGLDRINSGMDAANAAQSAERTRGQDYFNNEAAAGDRFNDQMLKIMLQALGVDADLFGQENSGSIAEGNAAKNNESENAQTSSDVLSSIYDFVS
jgi:hypothetical protein